jgi:DNA-binding MarR family transcriptional regulator
VAVDAGGLHRLSRLLREVATTATADPGEDAVSAGVLAIAEDVAHHEGTSIGEIASRTGLAQSMVSKTVALMRAEGVMATEQDPRDGRRMLVSLAPTTRTDIFESRAGRPVEQALRRVHPDLTDAQAQQVVALLDELARHLIP